MDLTNANLKEKIKKVAKNVWTWIKKHSIVLISVVTGAIFFVFTGKEILHHRNSVKPIRRNLDNATAAARESADSITESIRLNRALKSGTGTAKNIIEKIRNEQSLE